MATNSFCGTVDATANANKINKLINQNILSAKKIMVSVLLSASVESVCVSQMLDFLSRIFYRDPSMLAKKSPQLLGLLLLQPLWGVNSEGPETLEEEARTVISGDSCQVVDFLAARSLAGTGCQDGTKIVIKNKYYSMNLSGFDIFHLQAWRAKTVLTNPGQNHLWICEEAWRPVLRLRLR